MNNFADEKLLRHYLILNGQKIEANVAYQKIYSSAKKTILIVDDYINLKTLQLLKICNSSIKIVIISDNKARNNVTKEFIDDFKYDTGNDILIIKNNNRFHDRYVVIDFGEKNEMIYLRGSSSKDAGNKITTITRIEDVEIYKPLFNELLKNK